MESHFNQEQGSILAEFAIVLWVIVMFSLGSLEMARAINFLQLSAVLSREIATVAYRDCSVEKANDASFVGDCLKEVRNDFQNFANRLTVSSGFVVSVYKYDLTSKTVTLLGKSSSGGYSSSFDATLDPSAGLKKDVVVNHRIVVVGEAFIPYSPMFIDFSSSALNLNIGVFHNVTVI